MSILQPVIDLGLDEFRFWDMTLAEIERYSHGVLARKKEQAQFNYILADLIGISAARMMSDEVKYPDIEDAYPTLFAKTPEEIKQEREAEAADINSVNRFLEFAQKHNTKMRKGDGN